VRVYAGAGVRGVTTDAVANGGPPMLLLGMIVLGLATFGGMFAFVRFCDWV
jgi:hypothetical protein